MNMMDILGRILELQNGWRIRLRTPDYNLCHQRSRELAIRLYNSFRNPEICWGSYTPITPINTWDERWQERIFKYPSATLFVHFWVECQGRIWDRSLEQFGERPGLVIAKITDPRYDKYGVESLLGSKQKIVAKPSVIWDAFPEFSLKNKEI
jgi:hypothetical protein